MKGVKLINDQKIKTIVHIPDGVEIVRDSARANPDGHRMKSETVVATDPMTGIIYMWVYATQEPRGLIAEVVLGVE